MMKLVDAQLTLKVIQNNTENWTRHKQNLKLGIQKYCLYFFILLYFLLKITHLIVEESADWVQLKDYLLEPQLIGLK